MRSGPPSRRVLGAVALAVVLASCSASGGAGAGSTSAAENDDVTLEGFDDAEETSTTTTTTTTPTLTVDIQPDDSSDWTYGKLGEDDDEEEADAPGALEVDDCIAIAAELPYPAGEVAASWSAAESPLFMHNWDAYRADDVDRLPPIAESLDPEGLAARWRAAGFGGADWFWTDDGNPPIDLLVSAFDSHEGAVAAAKAYVADLCTEVSTAVPLPDGTGLSLTSTDGPSKRVYVVGSLLVDMTDSMGGLPGDPYIVLESWHEELRVAMGAP